MKLPPVQIADGGPRRVVRQAYVDGRARDLYLILANPHRHHEVDGSRSVKRDVIGPRELQVGDRFRVPMRMFGVPYAITSTCTDLRSERLVEWRHPAGHRWRWEFVPQAEGGTLVTETFDYTTSKFPKLIEFLRAPQRNGKGIKKSLVRLQKRYTR